ncbi:hypothetical protein AVEN_93459-1 [Araneus ventricosus]|uniref:Uncharacterized protein n=1 Tax=Araneus ventricosus TaxID=182803 RepID=A0A4Y2ARQ9_ARAVE|nr:hypothetical protein AVEN_93459-1 [Araneus ventricosus]
MPLLTKWGELSPPGISSVKESGGQRKVLVFPPQSDYFKDPQQYTGSGYTSDAVFSTSEEGSEYCRGEDEDDTSMTGEDGSDSEAYMSGNETEKGETTLSVHVLTEDGGKSLPDTKSVSSLSDIPPLPLKGHQDSLTSRPNVSTAADLSPLPLQGPQNTQTFSPTVSTMGVSQPLTPSGHQKTQIIAGIPPLGVNVNDTDDSGEYHSPPTQHSGGNTMFFVQDTQILRDS